MVLNLHRTHDASIVRSRRRSRGSTLSHIAWQLAAACEPRLAEQPYAEAEVLTHMRYKGKPFMLNCSCMSTLPHHAIEAA